MVVRRRPKPLLIFLIVTGSFLILLAAVYLFLVSPVDRNDAEKIEIVVPSGAGVSGIAEILKENDLIRSELLFTITVKSKGKLYLQASTYQFSRDMSMEEIIEQMTKGSKYNPDAISITFREGERITDYAEDIADVTNHSKSEVLDTFNDRQFLNKLIDKYWFLTNSILQEGIYYPLEGYLAPDTYQFDDKDVKVTTIIETMLDEMDEELRPYQDVIADNVHYYMTMASMIELEGTNTENRKMIAGILRAFSCMVSKKTRGKSHKKPLVFLLHGAVKRPVKFLPRLWGAFCRIGTNFSRRLQEGCERRILIGEKQEKEATGCFVKSLPRSSKTTHLPSSARTGSSSPPATGKNATP